MITSYQVLIVEDDKVQRMILDGYLMRTCRGAAAGREAKHEIRGGNG